VRHSSSLDLTLEFFRRFASPDLAELCILLLDNDYSFTMTQPFNWNILVTSSSVFSHLTDLLVLTDDDVSDWRLFSELPTTMYINFCTLTNEYDAHTLKPADRNNLSVFNRFTDLRFLRLKFFATDKELFMYEGDLVRLNLKNLYLEDKEVHGRNLASDLTFDHIPQLCNVCWCLHVAMPSAFKRLGYFGYKRTSTFKP